MILTDPPYGVNYRSNAKRTSSSDEIHSPQEGNCIKNDTPIRASMYYSLLIHESQRILRPGGCLCCFAKGGGSDLSFSHYVQLMRRIMEFKQIAVWDRQRLGLGRHYRQCYEFVLVAKKRGAPCKWRGGYGTGNVFRFKRPSGSVFQHPTPKPIELMAHLIEIHSDPGDIILDPFCGHGSTLLAAQATGRRYVGIDIESQHISACEARLERKHDA
ncbi:site-specific DNA-methyltransferase [bacterium]|nr:site-specific DNA-methyltransferase [bacterium]